MSRLPFPTRDELLALIKNSERDHQHARLELTPPWEGSRQDDAWKELRERSRRVTRLRTRLDMAKRKLDRDFDMNS